MGGFQVLGEVDLNDSQGKAPSTGLDVLGEVDLAPPKQYLPEVNKAVAAVPKPAPPRGLQPDKPLPPYDIQRAVVGGLTDIFTGGGMPSNMGSPPLGEPMAQGVREIETPGKRGTGALRVAATGTEALTPLMGPAALENPASIIRGLAEGTAASEGGGYLLKKAGVSDENIQNAKTVLFFAPGVARSVIDPKVLAEISPEGTRVSGTVAGGRAGAGVAVTPEAVTVRGKVGPFEGSKTFGRGQPTKTGIEPPTIEGQPGPPVSDDPAITSMVASRDAEVAAAKQAAGIPPKPPPAPPRIIDQPGAPPELKQNHVSQRLVDSFAGIVAQLPETMRAQAVQEAHAKLAQVLLEGSQHGPMVGPDGKLLPPVSDPEAASKQAIALINNAISNHEKVLAKASGEDRGGKAEAKPSPPGTASAITAGRAARAQAAGRVEVLGEVPLEATEVEKPSQEANGTPQGAIPAAVSAPADRAEAKPAVESATVEAKPGAEKTEAVVPKEAPLKKGDQAILAKDTEVGGKVIPKGTAVTVRFAHPNGIVVSAVTEDGTKVTRGMRAFTKGVQSGGEQKSGASTEQHLSDSSDEKAVRELPQGIEGTRGTGHPKASPQEIRPTAEKQGETPPPVRGTAPEIRQHPVAPAIKTSEPEHPSLEAPKPFTLSEHEKEISKPYGPPKANFGGKVPEENLGFNHKPAEDLGNKAREEVERRMGGALPRGKAEQRIAPEAQPNEVQRQKVGLPPTAGKVGEMNLRDLKVAPHKFQYKLATDAEGVSTLLKDVTKYDPELAGVISVWHDSADHKTYVVNGHHRYELAKRTGQKSVTVRHIVAPTAEAARATGALQNIAEGRGTAIDAAKFFRDSGLTPEQLKEKGISLGEKTASDGLAMSKLDPAIFQKVVSGDLRQGRAIAIGESTADPAEQKAILSLVEKKERSGAKVSDDTLSELIRLVKGSEQTTETTSNLFSTQEITRSLALEKAEISAHIKQQLSKDKKLFGFVAKEGRATELARAGNKIDVEKSKEISVGAAQAEEVYNLLSARGGPIASILDEAARKLADGENAGQVKSDAYTRIRAEVSQTLGGGERGSTERPEGTSEGKEDTGSSLFSPEAQLAPPFYSKAARIAFEKLPSSMSGDSALATLKNAGVKADEIKWIGLDDFLSGKPKVSKQDVLSYIWKNLVQVREVTKADTGDAGKLADLQRQRHDLVMELDRQGFGIDQTMDGYDVQEEGQNDWYKADHETGVPKEVPDHIAKQIEKVMALDNAISEVGHGLTGSSKTKYSSYTLPGEKKNYTELLLTLPSPPRKVMDTIAKEMGFGGWTNQLTEEQKDKVIAAFDRQPSAHEPFTTSHFDEPNILAHVRFDERSDADGKPILFVEEVQSDWHQKGKKVGYASDAQIKALEDEYEKATKARSLAYADLRPLLVKDDLGGWDSAGQAATDAERVARGNPGNEYSPETIEAARKYGEARDRENELLHQMETSKRGVPNAPFKSDWHELAMKTMLRKAAEGGYDKIGWVTGEQTAERYDLAKHVDEIRAARAADNNTFSVTAFKDGSPIFKKYDLDENAVADHVGKELAHKIAILEPGKTERYSGIDLKVGGEWAKNLYDRAIPNFLSKYGKKWGAKVGDTTVAGSGGPDTIHSLTITPEMRASVLSEGQPLFSAATGPILVQTAKAIDFKVKPTTKELPPYLELNPEATEAISRAVGVRLKGVNFDAKIVPEIVTKLKAQADKMERINSAGAGKLRDLANALIENADKNFGVNVIRTSEDKAEQLATLHEEMIHSGQRAAGGGDITKSVPWTQSLASKGMRTMASRRIIPHLLSAGIVPDPTVVVAEGLVDIMRGDAWEITDEQAHDTAKKYFEAMAKSYGTESVQRLQDIENFIGQEAEKLGVTYGRESVREAGRQALAAVLSGKTGTALQPTGKGATGGPEAVAGRGPETGLQPGNPGEEFGRRARAAAGGALASTQPVGLTDEELETWSKAKGFRIEPAGEQLGMFGGNEPVLRVFKSGARGKEQAGLVYQSQIDKLNAPKEEETLPEFSLTGGEEKESQPALFGAGDLGEIIGSGNKGSGIEFPTKEREDKGTSLFHTEKEDRELGAIGSYLREAKRNTDLARNLQRGLETLDTQKQADILRAVQTMKDLKEQGYSKPDDEAIYHHLENPEGENLSKGQEQWLDDTILPLSDRNSDLYTELTDGGIPIENYVHRVVKGKGGMLDRIAQGVKAIGQKATLSKSAPQTKSRTYMVLEKAPERSQGSVLTRPGERLVVSIKGGQVTAWRNGEAENMGGLSHTDEGKAFVDKDNNLWTLKQATTKEIEANTGTQYYHSALASTLASNIQLEAAVRAMNFLNAFKASADFKEISFDQNTKGNPPKGWKTTNLVQFKGYAFEPRTAEVLDWYADRMRQGNIGALEQVGQFMRVAMLLNPIMHPMNVAASWAVEKGASGFLMPTNFKAAWKSGNKAVKAVLSQNQDFLDALDAGAPLQSHREAIKDITKLFFDQLGEGLRKEEPWAMKVAKSLGIEHGNLLNILHKFSSKAAWVSNDMFFLQSAYENQAKNPGMSLQDALKETGRIIPEYRVPTRILDSPAISRLMTNKWATIFGSYHYGLLKSFGEVAKSALGAGGGVPPKGPRASETGDTAEEGPQFTGRTRAQEIAKGWDRLALIALVTMALYPILDELAKKATGDKHARVRRAGPFGLVDAAAQVAKHEQSVSTAAQRVVTPAPQTKAAAELAFNREFYAGHQIYDPHATFPVQTEQIGRYLIEQLGQIGQIEKAHTTEQKRKFLWGQVAVQFHKTAAEKAASDIAMSKVGTQAEDPEDQENRVLRREILDQLRKGNHQPLQEAETKHEITRKQVKNLEHRAHMTPLQDTVHGFSYSEARRVYELADQAERKELDPIMRQKRTNMFKAGRSREVTNPGP